MIKFEPKIIDDASAWLFWSLVAKSDFQKTLNDVLETRGRSVINNPERGVILNNYKVNDLPENILQLFYDEVAEYTFDNCIKEENIIGSIYLEDIELGRSPSAKNINTENYNIPIRVNGSIVELAGALCIRHPLPSVVFLTTIPNCKFFQIKNTKALGFNMPMYFMMDRYTKIFDELYLASGIFYIPENVFLMKRKWNEIILNSICSESGLSFVFNEGKKIELTYSWT